MADMLQHRIFIAIALFCYAGYAVHLAQAACNVCQDNGAACINDTAYYLCFGSSQPNTNQLFNCEDGLACTDLPTICFQRSERPASCDDTDSCGLCNSNLVFACTSRTTFAFCFGATKPSNVTGSCPSGRVCDASTQDICVNNIQSDSIICNEDNSQYFAYN